MKKLLLLIVVLLMVSDGLSYADLPVTSNIVVHLNGDNVSVDGSAIDTMIDISDNGNNAVPPYSTYAPTLVTGAANGYDALDFADGKCLEIASSEDFDFSECTIFMVFKYPEFPKTNTDHYILSNSYDIPADSNSLAWGFNDLQIRCTLGIGGGNAVIKAIGSSDDGVIIGEQLGKFRAFAGWNLVTLVWDPDQSNTVDGDIDIYGNVGSQKFPTTTDARKDISILEEAGTDEGATSALLQNHILTLLGGAPNYLVEGSYPGIYDPSLTFNGMIAEVVIYSTAFDDSQIQATSDYFYTKYGTGDDEALFDLDRDCEYYTITGQRPASDLTDDCKVDFADFVEVAENWILGN